jgi:DNA-binding protein YbaB
VGPITNLGACIVGRVAIDDSASPHMSDEAIAEDVIVACLTDATTAVTTLAKIRAAKAAQTVAKDAGK